MAISTFKQGTNGYTGSLDTTIRESRPTTDLRTQTGVNVDGVDSAGLRNQGLLQFGNIFGTGAGQIPLGATINSAVLKLQVTEGTSQAVSFHRMLTDWYGPTVTWNSLTNGIQTDGVEASATADATVASLSTGLRSINVTSSVGAWSQGAGNYGWAILMDGSNGWDFASSETTTAPVLEIDWSLPVQEPPGLVIVQSGGSTTVTEGGPADTLTIALKTRPTSDVTITVMGDDEIGLSEVSFTFTPDNWSTPQILSITAIDDEEAEANHTLNLSLTSSSDDVAYNGQSASVNVAIIDDDTVVPVPIIVHDTMIRASRPTQSFGTAGNVNIDGVDSAGLRNQGLLYFQNLFGNGEGQIPIGAVIRSATLTLNVTDSTNNTVTFHRMLTDWTALPSVTWNSLSNGIQTDGVEAVQTADVTLASIATGSARAIDVTQSVRAWAGGAVNYGWAILMDGSNGLDFTSSEGTIAPKLDIDWYVPQPNIVVTQTGGLSYVTEGGNTDTLRVALETAPTANVTITVAGNSDVTVGPTQLIFTPQNWQTAQVVTLTAVNDTVREAVETRNVTFTGESSDPHYQGRTATMDVTVYDNDSPSPPPLNPTLVATHQTTTYKMGDASGYGIGDPSGIAYVPGLNLLFVADSEHDEAPYNSAINLIAIRPDGTQVASYSLSSFSLEPTGLAYNQANGLLYITDDRVHKVFWVDPANPQVKLGEVELAPLGIGDAEDPTFDPVTGNMFLLDGSQRLMFELSATGTLLRTMNLPSVLADAEALAYDPETETFFAGSGATRGEIFQLDRNGNLITSFDILSQYPGILDATPRIKGLELAPSSNPGDGAKLSLYAVDYGLDQQPDGRVFEIDLGVTLPYA